MFASLGNIIENPHAGLVFVDFFDSTVGLHVNGSATIYETSELPDFLASKLVDQVPKGGSAFECWVVITVDEAYIHCSKHVPRLEKKGKSIVWGTDDPELKSTDFFESNAEQEVK